MFYKKENEQIISGEFVNTPNFILSEETKNDQSYPVDGWIWAESLDQAISLFLSITEQVIINEIPQRITMRQARLALSKQGLLSTIDNRIMNGTDEEMKIEWEYSSVVERSWEKLSIMGVGLGLSETDLDNLFIFANSL